MKITVEELLRWRLDQAGADAPPAPPLAVLRERTAPWWERRPELFRAACATLRQAHGLGRSRGARRLNPIRAVLLPASGEPRTIQAEPVFVQVADIAMTLRVKLESLFSPLIDHVAVNVLDENESVLGEFDGEVAASGEIRLTLQHERVREWKELTVASPMPFRLILREYE